MVSYDRTVGTHEVGVVFLAKVRSVREGEEGEQPGKVLVGHKGIVEGLRVGKLDRGADLVLVTSLSMGN